MQQKLKFMSNKKQNEELQSRREFFKKAAKAALPVVGAVVMSSIPFMKTEAATSGCNGCYTQCSSCTGTCQGKCENGCHGCGNSCFKSCAPTCRTCVK